MTRQCGDCTLCCKLLPMQSADNTRSRALAFKMVERGLMSLAEAATMIEDFAKPAGARCPYQHHRKGCAVYPRRPFGCRTWSCRWLINDDTADLRRPDRAHYVIDTLPDHLESVEGPTIPAVQVWLDPDYPDAHHDPALREFLARRAEEGFAALIRLNAHDGFVLLAPSLAGDGQWHEIQSAGHVPQHSLTETMAVIGRHVGSHTIRLAPKRDESDDPR